LQDGLKLDLNRLARGGLVTPGVKSGPLGIQWISTYWDQQIAAGDISSDLRGDQQGLLRIRIGSLDQWISLVARPRPFGGRQWYFVCPGTGRRASVLWKPPGARSFACRQSWGGQVAYASQFLDSDNRAYSGQAEIRSRLCAIGGFNADEWDLPPKPKWMRWRTYNRAQDKFERYEQMRYSRLAWRAAKLAGLI
jgi:hypothetical protein